MADMTGHDKIAIELELLENELTHNNHLDTFAKALHLLLSPELTYDQYTQLKNFTEKVDAIIKLGEVFPGTINGIKNEFNKLSDGKISVEYLDNLLHFAITGYEKEHQ